MHRSRSGIPRDNFVCRRLGKPGVQGLFWVVLLCEFIKFYWIFQWIPDTPPPRIRAYMIWAIIHDLTLIHSPFIFFFLWLLLTNLLFKLKFLHFFIKFLPRNYNQATTPQNLICLYILFIFILFFFATKVCTEFISVFNTIIIKWFNQKRFSKKGFPFVIPYGWLFKMIYYIILKWSLFFILIKKKCDFVCFTEPIYNKNYSSSFFLFTRKENYHVESKISRLL